MNRSPIQVADVTGDTERELRRHRALADPSRLRILAELGHESPLDARTLAARVGLHVNTVRAHLTVLSDASLVSSETLPSEGRGRPKLVYRAKADGPGEGDGGYRLLAEVLTALVSRFDPEVTEQIEETGEAWGRYIIDSPPPYRTLSDDEAVDRLVGLLTRLGFRPETLQAGGVREIAMRSCPFAELARRHQDVVCPIHRGLIRGALQELGATTIETTLEPFVQPDLCVVRLATGP